MTSAKKKVLGRLMHIIFAEDIHNKNELFHHIQVSDHVNANYPMYNRDNCAIYNVIFSYFVLKGGSNITF